MNKIRVCVVSPLYHPSLGGLGRQAQLLTERLSQEGIDIFVIARRMKGMPTAEFAPYVKVFRAWSLFSFLHTYEGLSLKNILASLSFSLCCCLILIRKRREFDIVHFHGASLPLFLNAPVLKLMGKRVIAKVAAAKVSYEAGALKDLFWGVGRLIIRLLSGVIFIAISSEIESGLRNDGFTRIRRISNFIDEDSFSPATQDERRELRKNFGFSNERIILFSGRFIERKGIEFLLKAWQTVSGQYPYARLVLLGGGELLDKMKLLAVSLKIDGSVQFTGHIKNVGDFLRSADLFVLPSLQEGMPNALLEAMACGLPLVATRIGGVEDIIEDGVNGILADPGDSASLAAGMIRVLKDEELSSRLSRESVDTIRNSFSLAKTVSRYLDLYRQINGLN